MTSRRNWLDLALGASASVLLLGLMLLTFSDVVARYLFNAPIRGAFELTELSLLVLIFCGLPLVSVADDHVTMDFIDQWVGGLVRKWLRRLVHLGCGVIILLLSWQVWLKAGKIGAYGDTTDVLKVPVAPFVYLMAVMVAVTGLVHLFKSVSPGDADIAEAFDPDKSSTT